LAYTRSFSFGDGKEQLIREIQSSFDTYLRTRSSENGNIDRIYIMTENGELPLDLTEDELSGTVPGVSWHISATGDDLALGLALTGARPCPRSISDMVIRLNLRRQIAQEERAVRRKAICSRLARMSPAIAIPVFMAVSGALWWQVREIGREVHSLKGTQELSRQQVGSTKQLIALEKELQKQTSFLDWSTESYPMVSYRLYQIAQTIPNSLWLKEVYIPEQRTGRRRRHNTLQPISDLRVVGYAHKQEEIREFLIALSRCDCFTSIKQESTSEVRVSGERLLEFEIALISHPEKVGTELAKAGIDR
jgi:hypothetical protein